MSSDESRQEQNKRRAADQRTTPIEPDAWLITFKAFVEEYKRNSAEEKRQSQAKMKWDKTVAVGVCIYTAITLGIFWIGWQQFSIADDQERAQLRPYVMAEFNRIDIPEEGKRLMIGLNFENIGNTPVYDGKLYPIFTMTADKLIHENIPTCRGYDPATAGPTFGKERSYSFPSELVFTKEQISAINTGTNTLVFIGRYCYSDIFGETNWTDACLYWKMKDREIKASYCDSFNQAVSNSTRRGFLDAWQGWLNFVPFAR
jgi:hypothetical protein